MLTHFSGNKTNVQSNSTKIQVPVPFVNNAQFYSPNDANPTMFKESWYLFNILNVFIT